MSRAQAFVACFQAAYFLLTGIWPLVHMESFLQITGPKTELWLVKTVGALVSLVGTVLVIGLYRRRLPLEVRFLAIGASFILLTVDANYVAQRVIPPIYLLDAAIEIILIVAWFVTLPVTRREEVHPPARRGS